MIRTVIAEDEMPLLRGLGQMIEQIDPRFQVVCSARNGKEAPEYLTQHSADVLFTDINMPVLNGLGLIEQARQLDPGSPASSSAATASLSMPARRSAWG